MALNMLMLYLEDLPPTMDSNMQRPRPTIRKAMGWPERTVQTIKGLLQKSAYSGIDFQLALLAYRTTPHGTTGVVDGEAATHKIASIVFALGTNPSCRGSSEGSRRL